MNKLVMVLAAGALVASGAAVAKEKPVRAKTTAGMLTVYEGQKFEGDRYQVDQDRTNMALEFTIGSIAVYPGEKWEVCERPRFQGACMTLDADTTALGRISIRSARVVK